MRKILLTISLACISLSQSSAQRLLGVATSNWSGTNGLYLNPACIADSRTRFSLDIFTYNMVADNDLGKFSLKDATGSATTANIFTHTGGQKFDMLFPAMEARLPGLVFSAGPKNSFALAARIRAFNQFHNFDNTFFDVITNPPSPNTPPDSLQVDAGNFNWTMHAWSEIRFTYARVILDRGQHFVKAGITGTHLGGIGFVSVVGSINSQYAPGTNTLISRNSDVWLQTNVLDSATRLKGGVRDAFSQFFGSPKGNGWGMDIGLEYELRTEDEYNDDPARNKYKVRASLAVTDIGGVRYDSRGAHITGSGKISGEDLGNNFQDYKSFTSYAGNHGFTLVDTMPKVSAVKLPTAVIVGVDYHIKENVYVNATCILNAADRAVYGNSYYTQLTFTPRWDSKRFSIGLPLTVNTMSGPKLGLGLRYSGLIVGSDDMLLLLGGYKYGVNFYVGGYAPISKPSNQGYYAHGSSSSF